MKQLGQLVLIGLVFILAAPAGAQSVWTNWTTFTTGAPGSASGALSGATVSYAGEVLSTSRVNGSAGWTPNSSWVGGAVDIGPISVNDILVQNGTYTGTNTLTFSSPVKNPVIAIWSLGDPKLCGFMDLHQCDAVPPSRRPELVVRRPVDHSGRERRHGRRRKRHRDVCRKPTRPSPGR